MQASKRIHDDETFSGNRIIHPEELQAKREKVFASNNEIQWMWLNYSAQISSCQKEYIHNGIARINCLFGLKTSHILLVSSSTCPYWMPVKKYAISRSKTNSKCKCMQIRYNLECGIHFISILCNLFLEKRPSTHHHVHMYMYVWMYVSSCSIL